MLNLSFLSQITSYEVESNIWQALIAGAKLSVANSRKKELELKSGMDIFGMPQPPLKVRRCRLTL
jgi:hypothetical protein